MRYKICFVQYRMLVEISYGSSRFYFYWKWPSDTRGVVGLAKKLSGKKVIYNLQDIFPDSLVTSVICDQNSIFYCIGRKVEAASLLKDNENIRFVVFGNGSEEGNLKQMIAENHLNNISLFPLQPVERVSEVYSMADVLFLVCRELKKVVCQAKRGQLWRQEYQLLLSLMPIVKWKNNKPGVDIVLMLEMHGHWRMLFCKCTIFRNGRKYLDIEHGSMLKRK